MFPIIPKNETGFWHIFRCLLIPAVPISLLFCLVGAVSTVFKENTPEINGMESVGISGILVFLALFPFLAVCGALAFTAAIYLDRRIFPKQVVDPGAPVFELFLGNDKAAFLHEPKREDMFWCSYRLKPLSDIADRILHEEATWKDDKFTIRAKDGRIPNAHTFTGGDFRAYCQRKSDRISFRSLWPIDA